MKIEQTNLGGLTVERAYGEGRDVVATVVAGQVSEIYMRNDQTADGLPSWDLVRTFDICLGNLAMTSIGGALGNL